MKATDKAEAFLRYWRLLAKGVPAPCAEYRFCEGRKFRADFAFPAHRVLVEIDGGQWAAQGGRHARDTDREKLNIAAAQGWRVLRFSPDMMANDPQSCIDRVREALEWQTKEEEG